MHEYTADLVGQTLSNCTLERLIGTGGMGAVYLARQQRPQRYVAIKILQPNLINQDIEYAEQFIARFRREADIIAKLEHANIIPIYEYDEQNGLAFLVMPYLSGGSLRDLLTQRGPLPLEEVASYLDQAASALDYAHAHGVIHRDLKPANFLLHSDGRLILTDFGIARIAEESAPGHTLTQPGQTLTQPGHMLGTPDYMAPEMITGELVDYRADIYELGIVIFTLLSGRVPFDGLTPLATLARRLRDPLPPLHALKPEIPSSVDEVLQKATAFRREDRYTSLRAMSQDMRKAMTETFITRTIPAAINLEQIPTNIYPRISDIAPTPHPPVQEPEPSAPIAAPITPVYTTNPPSLNPNTNPTTSTMDTTINQNLSPSKQPSFKWPFIILCTILLIGISVFIGMRLAWRSADFRTGNYHSNDHYPYGRYSQTPTTITPTPTITSTPTLPPATGALLYSTGKPGSNCDSNGGTWITYNNAQVTCKANATNITNTAQSNTQQGIFLTAIPGHDYPANYVISAQIQLAANSNGDFGLYFRNQPGNQTGVYTFMLHTDGSWTASVYDNVSGQPKELAKGQLGNLTNSMQLEVVVRGPRFVFFVNGDRLGRLDDLTYTQGTVGIAVNQGANINVSKFSLYAIKQPQ